MMHFGQLSRSVSGAHQGKSERLCLAIVVTQLASDLKLRDRWHTWLFILIQAEAFSLTHRDTFVLRMSRGDQR